MEQTLTPNKITCQMFDESRATCCDTLTFIDTYADLKKGEYAKATVFMCDISISIFSIRTGKLLRVSYCEFFTF
jgi:hypothetical protein